ncbi:Mannose or cellobiose epimerase, N-acyl-D-glucosamine 2-epimerase family [Fictibacillus solisalsi]|uniref:Mannose or cellobiose epimerase, N-acyl-D-glucosamine 2-epimerase family n=1 Tax=Fictibacillus solisalsi TaxID=459525 RepID=A0A1G9U594_9BACL|nr:AGE family epimerase/isomerase [Fictibacillus solisalsi]SDM55048.1 Mannose or cellobiose epimerase, N-acyl-D-glucosamine 2-epimerase family [Fictibacillus solisalsi]
MTDIYTEKGWDKEWLTGQVMSILNFYYPNCMDRKNGGYLHTFKEDGSVLKEENKHLVGTSRFIYLFSTGALLGGPAWCKEAAAKGLDFLCGHHLDKKHGGFYLELIGQIPTNKEKYMYGHAFAFLAAIMAQKAGIDDAKHLASSIFNEIERHFWDRDYGLYKDHYSENWGALSPYRGQNANMHMCEALIAAYETTRQQKFLDRAVLLARNVTLGLAAQSGGMIWEHFDKDWRIDWSYNKGNTKDEMRPYGFIPGHSIEWSKLLLLLERHLPQDWMLPRALELYREGMNRGWDKQFGGFFYSLDPNKQPIDHDKNYWVVAEALASSALFARRTGQAEFKEWYGSVLDYASKNFIDHEHGGWYKLLNRENQKYSNTKSRAPKTDYHPAAAFYEILKTL